MYAQELKGLGNKRQSGVKLHFLRYSTGESGMISGFQFCRPFVKILISRFKISLFPFQEPRKIPGKFRKFSANFPKIFRKFIGIFPTPTPTLPTHPPYPPPIRFTSIPLPHTELQVHFSRFFVFPQNARLFPTPFNYLLSDYQLLNTVVDCSTVTLSQRNPNPNTHTHTHTVHRHTQTYMKGVGKRRAF